MREFHRPVRFDSTEFAEVQGGDDPAVTSQVAHETAQTLLASARANPDPELLERLVTYTDKHGLAELADLWSASPSRSLPGVLWRLYLLRVFITKNPVEVSYLFSLGQQTLPTIDPVVAGVESPVGPDEVRFTADEVLRGAFRGDFSIALDRAAAFCRVTAHGCTDRANEIESTDPDEASVLTRRALRLQTISQDFTEGGNLWRRDALD